MAKKIKESTATLGFEAKLWHAADLMRGKLPATQYRQVLMGLLFLRYVSDAFENRYRELKAEGYGDEEDRDAYMEKNIFFVPKSARWERIAAVAHEANNGETIDNAMIAIERENKALKGVLPKFYGSTDINKRMLGDVIDLFTNELPLGDIEANRDILGRTYEYCIQHFAEYEGKKGGEYHTPETIVRILVEVLQPAAGMRIYDPCCGSGGMFAQSVKFIETHSGSRGDVSVFGQEANPDTWKMSKINMAIRGIGADFGMGHEDTLMHDIHAGTQMDRIFANPPFNQKKWGADRVKDDPRWKYGLPPDGNANYAWIQHMISHLKPKGRIGLVLANGALTSATGGEDKIRQAIIEDDLVEGIVSLPSRVSTGIRSRPQTASTSPAKPQQTQKNQSQRFQARPRQPKQMRLRPRKLSVAPGRRASQPSPGRQAATAARPPKAAPAQSRHSRVPGSVRALAVRSSSKSTAALTKNTSSA